VSLVFLVAPLDVLGLGRVDRLTSMCSRFFTVFSSIAGSRVTTSV